MYSKLSVTSTPRSVFSAIHPRGKGQRVFVIGCADGCIRVVEATDHVAMSGKAELIHSRPKTFASSEPGSLLAEVSAITVMSTVGLVVAGHVDGFLTLWRSESGNLLRRFNDERGDTVSCIDTLSDGSLAVSGHSNGCCLVWGAAAGQLLFRHSSPVICVTVAANKKPCVTVDANRVVRVWSAQNKDFSRLEVKTKLKWSAYGSRGAFPDDGTLLSWASRRDGDRKWRASLLNISLNCESTFVTQYDENDSDWIILLEKVTARLENGTLKVHWRFGSGPWNQLVELQTGGLDQARDKWRISSGTENGEGIPDSRRRCNVGMD